jgi:nucleotide-binding universal stress UspA family protein
MKIIFWNDRLLTSNKTHTLMLLVSGHVDYGVTAVQSPRDAAAAEKNVNEGAKDLIAKYVKLCAQSEITCEGEVVKGEAASWIVDEAERLNAQLVVMGSHAYGVLKR